jgi:hypothetical protein
VKKNVIKLSPILSKAPKIMGQRVDAMVTATLTALTPVPTTLVGKSSTMYTRNNISSVAIAKRNTNITITSMTLYMHMSQFYGLGNTISMSELITVVSRRKKPDVRLSTLSMR